MNKNKYINVFLLTFLIMNIGMFFVAPLRVTGYSMEPTISNNSIVLVYKYHLRNYQPKINDIVMIDSRELVESDDRIIKRVIAIEGDTVEFKNNDIYVNNVLVAEDYIIKNEEYFDWKFTVGEGEVFVLGDNRDISFDSRYFGSIDYRSDVIGKVIFHF